jgi:hypothetical protein
MWRSFVRLGDMSDEQLEKLHRRLQCLGLASAVIFFAGTAWSASICPLDVRDLRVPTEIERPLRSILNGDSNPI